MIEEKFAGLTSPIHGFDPRVKIISCIIFIFSVASLKNMWISMGAFVLGFILISLAKLLKKETFLTLLKVNGFIVFLWLVLPFTTQGHRLLSLWKLNITQEGIYFCANITLKSNAILMGIISLLLTQPTPVIGQALSSLRFPSKFCFLLLMTYRYINLIYSEYNRLMTAAKIRGFVPRTNIHTYKTIGYIFSMVLIKSYDRAERIYQAMVLRGFRGKFYSLYDFSITRKDCIFGCLMVLLSGFLVAIDMKTDYFFKAWKHLF